MSKKMICLLLALCLSTGIILSGCNQDDSGSTTGSTAGTEPVSTAGSTPAAEPVSTSTAPSTGSTQEPAQDTTAAATGETAGTGTLSLNRQDVTFSAAGMSWGLYDGTVEKSSVTWSSSDETIVTFQDGVITAVGPGTTTVSAEYDGQIVSCIVRCKFSAVRNDPTEPADTTPPGTDPTPSTAPPVSTGGPGEPVKAPPAASAGPCAFYNDAAFIGDSVSMMLRNYSAGTGDLGSALFLVRGSYSVGHAVNGTMLLTYQGQEMAPEDALAAAGVSKVFIMLGMNDLGIYGVDGTIENWESLITRIREKNPNIEIYIQSMTPIWTGGEKGSLTNSNTDSYNAKLQTLAQSSGCHYVDVASYMKDSTGGLATVYCSDSYVHLTNAGAETWVKVLKAYAGS